MGSLLSRVGIGAATIDIEVSESPVIPGDEIPIDVTITGGDSAQYVRRIKFELVTNVETDDGTENTVIHEQEMDESFEIEPNETHDLGVMYELPQHMPITNGRTGVWVKATLDIKWGVNQAARTKLDVNPPPRQQALLRAFDRMGFHFRESECHHDENGRYTDEQDTVQVFTFTAETEPFATALDELEVVSVPRDHKLTAYLEANRSDVLIKYMDDNPDDDLTAVTVKSEDSRDLEDDLREGVRDALA